MAFPLNYGLLLYWIHKTRYSRKRVFKIELLSELELFDNINGPKLHIE